MSDENSGHGAQDNKKLPAELPLAPDGSVDIDRIRLKLLIICRAKPQLDTIANYLVRRGWETIVTRETKEAFKVLSTFKPDYVLISVNVPNPKINQLPTVIFNTFKVPSITFGESLNTKTMKALQSILSNYTMPGAISGPSVHRRIKQILQEIYKPEKKVSAEESPLESENDTFTITGSKNKKVSYSKEQSAKDRSGVNHGSVDVTQDEKKSAGGVYIAKGEAKPSTGVAYRPKESDHLDSAKQYKKRNPSEELKSSGASEENVDFEALAAEYGQESTVADGDEATDAIVTDEQIDPMSITAEGERRAESSGGLFTSENGFTKAPTIIESNSATSNFGTFTAGENKSAPSHGADREMGLSEASDRAQAVIANHNSSSGAINAILQIAKASALPIESVKTNTNHYEECTVIAVRQKQERIFILAFVSGSVHDEIQYISNFMSNLKSEYPRAVNRAEIEEPLRIAMQVTREELQSPKNFDLFQTYSIESGRGRVELIVTYGAEFESNVANQSKSKMALIDVGELVPNTPVGVDVFLHLPKNNKHYLYLKPRATISQAQKDRLIQAAAKLFISVQDIDIYREAAVRNKTIEKILAIKSRIKAA